MSKAEKTLSGLHPDIMKHSRRNNISPVIVKSAESPRPISCWVTLPGCDFEVMILDEVAVTFRREDVYVARDDVSDSSEGKLWKKLPRKEFNKQLLDNMMIALRNVTGKGDIVAESRHFMAVMVAMIKKLDKLSSDLKKKCDGATDIIADQIDTIKLEVFRQLMSQDLRK